MKKIYKAIARFIQKEWFLFVALIAIAIIFLIYEFIT